jgi:hypothetical protein
MAYLSQFPMSEAGPAVSSGARRLALAARLSSMARRIGGYIDTMADFYAAATVYEQLSGLSDAELHRRGLSRADLARDILAARGRTATPD